MTHISLTEAAERLHCPPGFYRLLADRDIMPVDVDGMIDRTMFNRARLDPRRKWVNLLDERLGRDEARRIDPRLELPPDHLTDLGGVVVAPLWRILEWTWTRSGRMPGA